MAYWHLSVSPNSSVSHKVVQAVKVGLPDLILLSSSCVLVFKLATSRSQSLSLSLPPSSLMPLFFPNFFRPPPFFLLAILSRSHNLFNSYFPPQRLGFRFLCQYAPVSTVNKVRVYIYIIIYM